MNPSQAPQGVASRHVAGIFDLQVPGPAEQRGWDKSSEAIGGYYGVAWWNYFKDVATGEIYIVECTDGVNGGHGPYSNQDETYRAKCYDALLERCRTAAQSKAYAIYLSRNERALIQSVVHARLLESAEGLCDGKQSVEGLEGGLMGHYHGTPVICDLGRADDLPPR